MLDTVLSLQSVCGCTEHSQHCLSGIHKANYIAIGQTRFRTIKGWLHGPVKHWRDKQRTSLAFVPVGGLPTNFRVPGLLAIV